MPIISVRGFVRLFVDRIEHRTAAGQDIKRLVLSLNGGHVATLFQDEVELIDLDGLEIEETEDLEELS